MGEALHMLFERWSHATRIRLVIFLFVIAGVLQGHRRTFDLLTATVTDIQAAVASGALTYEQLNTPISLQRQNRKLSEHERRISASLNWDQLGPKREWDGR